MEAYNELSNNSFQKDDFKKKMLILSKEAFYFLAK